jgi:hypothetical protein
LPTDLTIVSGALTTAVARMEPRIPRPRMGNRSGPATSPWRSAGHVGCRADRRSGANPDAGGRHATSCAHRCRPSGSAGQAAARVGANARRYTIFNRGLVAKTTVADEP